MSLVAVIAVAAALWAPSPDDTVQVDFALNEQCLAYEECLRYQPFVRAGKAVFHIEYQGEWPKAKSCEVPGFSIRARLSLRGFRASCSV